MNNQFAELVSVLFAEAEKPMHESGLNIYDKVTSITLKRNTVGSVCVSMNVKRQIFLESECQRQIRAMEGYDS